MEDQTENIENISTSFDKIDEKMHFMKEEFSEVQLYSNLKIEFENCFTAMAKNGGLIAFCKKPKVFIMDSHNPIKNNVIVMCQDGSNYIEIPYHVEEREKFLILFDFTHEEKLYGIHNDGTIFKFDILTQTAVQKVSGDTFKNEKIVSAKFFENGFVALTEINNFYLSKEIKNPQPYLFISLSMININDTINDYLFLPPSCTTSKNIELIFPYSDKNGVIHVIGKNENENFSLNEKGEFNGIFYIKKDVELPFSSKSINEQSSPSDLGKICSLALSPSNSQIAMYRNDGTVFFFHSSLNMQKYQRMETKFTINDSPNDEFEQSEQKAILEYNENTQFLFCGEDAVCICGKRFILLVNAKKKTLYYKITERSGQSAMLNISFMYCISESDGLRVFTLKNIFFISKVSKQLYNTCYPFSEDPAKKLLSAYKSAQEKQANCDKEIREIALKLGDAIKTLSQVAAGLFWTNDNDKNKQIQLYILKAAQHGKSFVQNNELNYDLFVQTCKEIRIMNNLHSCNPNQDKPRFITYAEFKQMGAKDLIKKLIRQQNFALAYDMSKYLDYNVKKVFQRYAIAKIKKKGAQSKSEQTQLYEEISNQLKNIPNISYIKLAKKAFKYGAKDIGIKFLENEKSILTRIPQYIQLKEWDKAISLAFETYDRNVLLTVIDKIFKDRDIDVPKFLTIVSKFENINSAVIEYLKKNVPDQLEKYLNQKNLYDELFFMYLEKFFRSKDLTSRKEALERVKEYQKILEKKPGDFDYKFYRNYVSDLENSLKLKAKCLEKGYIQTTDTAPFDNSVYDCFKAIIEKGDNEISEAENKIYDISPKKYMILRLRAYAEMNRFDAIDNVLKGNTLKKLNLTPLNLAELYVDYKKYDKAVEYIKQITESDYFDYKIEMLKYMEKYSDALECIISDKDCDRKDMLVNDILAKKPDLKTRADELFAKYGH